MATSVADYLEGHKNRLLRDMRSDVKVKWWHVAQARARRILEIDPNCQEAKDCLKEAETALAAQKKS
ncbi:MAG: hypothetical protein HYW97_02315 [Candidatus Wildermuthbacteria bacterium]|nr:hypothetical protein [Candidatus Wildermuthbacteria bacterium]